MFTTPAESPKEFVRDAQYDLVVLVGKFFTHFLPI